MGRVLPILFNTDMVRAILDGRKTVTRRVCKDGNDFTVPDMSFYDADKRSYAVHNYADKEHTDKLSLAERTCPICPGDVLYVRETWAIRTAHRFEASVNVMFKAGGKETVLTFPNGGTDNADRHKYDGFLQKWDRGEIWHPSIHMPKDVARIWLKVTDVRVEHLQDMTLDDFLSEGVAIRPEAFNDPENAYHQAKGMFINIWDSTVKEADKPRYGWDASPWVWVIEFERCGKPEGEQ